MLYLNRTHNSRRRALAEQHHRPIQTESVLVGMSATGHQSHQYYTSRPIPSPQQQNRALKLKARNCMGGAFFPICDERTVFNAEIRVPPTAKSRLKLPGVRRADAAKVRRRQPYLLPPKRRPKHALALLSTINNDDKHRAIQPVWAHATRIDIEITDTQDSLIPGAEFRRHPAQPLKTGAELAFVPARKTGPDPQINVKMDVMAEPGIADAISAAEWVSRCGVVLWQLLREFSTQPPEITELGATLIEL